MKEKNDLVTKDFVAYPDVAADIINVLLHQGKQRWDDGRSMGDLFGKEKKADEVWKYVDDLKLHVFEMRYLPQKLRELFTSDMRIVVDFLAEGKGYRSNQKVIHKEALIKMLRVLSGDENVEDTALMLKEINVREEDNITMCELFDQYTRAGRREGRREGLQKGIQKAIEICREVGLSFEETCSKVKEKYTLGEEEAMQNMKLYW